MPVPAPAPGPSLFASELCRMLLATVRADCEKTLCRIGREWKLTFLDDAQVVGLGLDDALEALDVACQVFDFGFVEFGGGFGVLGVGLC